MGILHVVFLILLLNPWNVSSAPLPFELELPQGASKADPEGTAKLRAAHREVKLQIDAMHKVVQNPDKKEHQEILRHTFGDNYALDAIKQHVQTLRSGTVKVASVNSADMDEGVRAKTTASGKPHASVKFGPLYHDEKKTSDIGRTGTLLHEGSHALLGTKDFFSKDGKKPIGKSEHDKDKKDGRPGYSGYIAGKQYHELKGNGFSNMHQNADSWKAFGHHALHGKPHPNFDQVYGPAKHDANAEKSHRKSSGAQLRSKSVDSGTRRQRSSSLSRGGKPQRTMSLGRSRGLVTGTSSKHGPQSRSRSPGPRKSTSRSRNSQQPTSPSRGRSQRSSGKKPTTPPLVHQTHRSSSRGRAK